MILTIAFGYRFKLIFFFEFLNALEPAVLLILAICRVNSSIKRLVSTEIRTRELLIRIHTYTFVFYSVVNFANDIMSFLVIEQRYQNDDD